MFLVKMRDSGPPAYPWPIEHCDGQRGPLWLRKLACGILGHETCGYHWEQQDENCCRCQIQPSPYLHERRSPEGE